MTSLDDRRTKNDGRQEQAGARLRRAWRLLLATLAVWRGCLVAAGHRHGPRAARAATRTRQNLAGAAVAFLLALLLWGRPLAHAWAASPRWAEIATALAARLCARVVALSVAAILLLCWLVGPFSTFGTVLLVPALAWLTLRGWVAYYPHTTRGRVRVRYGIDGFAGYWDLHRHLSAHAVRQVAPEMRPSIAAALPEAPDSAEQVRAVGGPGIAAGVRTRRLWLVERLPVSECGTWSGGEDSERWNEWATGVLAALLMAAARAGENMATVAHWVYTQKTGAEAALGLLQEGFETPVPQLVVDALAQVTTTEARRTRDAIFMTMRGAVGFMAEPEIAAVCCPDPDDDEFDVAAFIAGRGTLYLLGADDGTTAPLLAAFTGYIFETAKHLAADYPKGRLDPPLMLALDEAALITPVPLDRWLADAGGRGIHVIWAVQSPSQLAATWGERGADTIMNATNVTMVYGGLKLHADLDAISKLCDTRLELVPDPDDDGPGHARFERVPVVPPARVRTIPQWHALLIHRATLPTLVRLVPYWERADVRAAVGGSAKPTPGASETTHNVAELPSDQKDAA